MVVSAMVEVRCPGQPGSSGCGKYCGSVSSGAQYRFYCRACGFKFEGRAR